MRARVARRGPAPARVGRARTWRRPCAQAGGVCPGARRSGAPRRWIRMPAHCGSSSPGRLIVRPPGHRSSSESPDPADGHRGRRVVRPRLAAVGLIQVTDHEQPRVTARAGALAVPVARAPPGPDSVPRRGQARVTRRAATSVQALSPGPPAAAAGAPGRASLDRTLVGSRRSAGLALAAR